MTTTLPEISVARPAVPVAEPARVAANSASTSVVLSRRRLRNLVHPGRLDRHHRLDLPPQRHRVPAGHALGGAGHRLLRRSHHLRPDARPPRDDRRRGRHRRGRRERPGHPRPLRRLDGPPDGQHADGAKHPARRQVQRRPHPSDPRHDRRGGPFQRRRSPAVRARGRPQHAARQGQPEQGRVPRLGPGRRHARLVLYRPGPRRRRRSHRPHPRRPACRSCRRTASRAGRSCWPRTCCGTATSRASSRAGRCSTSTSPAGQTSAAPASSTEEEIAGRRVQAVKLSRVTEKDTHNETGITQEINRDVSAYRNLAVTAWVKVSQASLSGGGYLGSEYPVMIRVNYTDEKGGRPGWTHGFYFSNPENRPTENGEIDPAGPVVPVPRPPHRPPRPADLHPLDRDPLGRPRLRRHDRGRPPGRRVAPIRQLRAWRHPSDAGPGEVRSLTSRCGLRGVRRGRSSAPCRPRGPR